MLLSLVGHNLHIQSSSNALYYLPCNERRLLACQVHRDTRSLAAHSMQYAALANTRTQKGSDACCRIAGLPFAVHEARHRYYWLEDACANLDESSRLTQ